ncbi:MAG: histidinol-phosphatase HisJ family protein [Candidatus Izemoplasmatales bacterium]|nr:histidinol-phosphatase HisJ family protein [bacterium]MDZ4195745.1 histidinol-phosphatase HisJ family protein [Candidatus Izemoplasmatales bacterium]
MIDQHTHTLYSPDASKTTTFLDYVNQAKQRGFSGIMVTDHVDFDCPDPLFQSIIDYTHYFEDVLEAKTKSNFDIRVGVELGYQRQSLGKIKQLVQTYPFDLVLLSIHYIDGLDPYDGSYFKGKSHDESIQRYFETVYEAITQCDDFDIFGHFDYITRYGDFENRTIALEDHQEIIDSILLTLISKQKGIEINMSGIDERPKRAYPSIDILKRYHALGGSIITIGSDAHHEKKLGRHFDIAIKILKEAGFQEIALFKNRIPVFYPLDELL